MNDSTPHPTQRRDDSLVISCGDCVLAHTTACADYVVTFVHAAHEAPGAPDDPVNDFTAQELEVIERLVRAGMVPSLRHCAAA